MTDQTRRTVLRLVSGAAVVGGTVAAIPGTALATSSGDPDAELAALFEQFMQTEREWSAICDERNKLEGAGHFFTVEGLRLDDQEDAVVARQNRVKDRMNETPAETPQGVLYKLLVAARDACWNDAGTHPNDAALMVLAVIGDLERLAG